MKIPLLSLILELRMATNLQKKEKKKELTISLQNSKKIKLKNFITSDLKLFVNELTKIHILKYFQIVSQKA